MPEPSGRPTFGQIYRQQYRQVSSSRTSKAFRFITPLVLLIGAVVFRHSVTVAIIMGGLAILILAGVVIWSRIHHQGEMQ
jgi:drug/metabolite transporter (DMT)-like permease